MGLKTSFDRSELPQDLAAITHFPPVSDHLTPPAQQANSHYTPFPLTTRKIILSDETLGEAARFEMLASRYDCIIGSSPYINSLVRIVSRINGIFLAAREGKQASYQLCCYNDFLNESPPTTNKGTVGISRLESFGLNEINRDVFNASRCACQMANIETKLLDSGLPSTITPSFILSLHSTLSGYIPSRRIRRSPNSRFFGSSPHSGREHLSSTFAIRTACISKRPCRFHQRFKTQPLNQGRPRPLSNGSNENVFFPHRTT